jgi:signal transduction histidine kinase/PAS domain-containing protein
MLVTLVDLASPAIHPFQQPINLGSSGRVDIVDQFGRVLVSSMDERSPNSEQAQDIIGDFFRTGAASIQTCHRCNPVDDGEALDEIMAFAPLQTATWGVLIRENANDVLRPVHHLSLLNLIYGTLSVLGALGLVWVTTSSVIDPIQRITQAAIRITQGDLDTPLRLERGDEIGEMGRSFDSMRLRLKNSIDEIHALNEDLDARVHERTQAALQAQIEAQEARDDLRSVIDALSDELVVVEVESHRIEQANYAAQLKSSMEESIVGKSCTRTFQRHDICKKSEGGCPIPIVLQTKDSVKITHEFHCPETNRQRYIDVVASPMFDMNGKVTRVVELRRDVTDQHMLSESLIRRNQQLSILNSIANTVNQSLDISEILDRALEEVLRLTDIDVGAIFLQSEQLGNLELMSYRGMSKDAAALASQFGMLEGSCGGVIELGQVVIVPDISRYRGKRARSLKNEDLNSLVHVPLTAKGETLGSMCVATRCQRTFPEEEQNLLRAIGSQIAVAIENARLYAEVQRREKLRGWLFKRAINAQEEERKRIARELHDETSQALTALIYASEQALILEEREALDDRLESMRHLAQNTLDGVHQIILDLRPTMLDHLGLVPAVRWLATSHLEPKGVNIVVEDNADFKRLPSQFETAVFRVVQETITNIARHSAARNVRILFETVDSMIKIMVEDDGIGFNMEHIAVSSDDMRGMGLMGMTERVELMGGQFQISSAPGQGTQVLMHVPIEGNPNGKK